MSEKKSIIEIQVQGDRNRNLYFVPLDRIIRGRFELMRENNESVIKFRDNWPASIDGQVLGVDIEASIGYVLEPIHSAYNVKSWVENKQHMRLAPQREDTRLAKTTDLHGWLFWMKSAVDCKKAVLLKGEFPSRILFRPKEHPFDPEPKPMAELVQKRMLFDPDFALRWAQATEEQRNRVLAGAV